MNEAEAADVLAFTNGEIQNIASVWSDSGFVLGEGSFVSIDNGGLYGSSFIYKYEKNEEGLYEQVKSFEFVNDESEGINIYLEDGIEVSQEEFTSHRSVAGMDDMSEVIYSAGDYHVLEAGIAENTSVETMDELYDLN